MDVAAANARWSAAFVDQLARAGVRDACACPGSRSTPLAIALAEHPGIKLWMHLDERSASFFALGMAKYDGRPVALLCTSGSAAANFFPAVVEARYSRVPLLVLTADRPHELRDSGAPQTIDQLRLYGVHAKWFVEMALPENTETALRYARMIAARAAAVARTVPAGPVHLNFPFREPFIPTGETPIDGAAAQSPHVVAHASVPAPAENAVAELAAERLRARAYRLRPEQRTRLRAGGGSTRRRPGISDSGRSVVAGALRAARPPNGDRQLRCPAASG